jgi:hypothetical protein
VALVPNAGEKQQLKRLALPVIQAIGTLLLSWYQLYNLGHDYLPNVPSKESNEYP